MIYFLKHECHRCKTTGESALSVSGKHIKQSCGTCLAYVKFLPHYLVPGVADIRARIWAVAAGDIKAIEKAKTDAGYTELEPGTLLQLEWYRVYFQVLTIKKLTYEQDKTDGEQGKAVRVGPPSVDA